MLIGSSSFSLAQTSTSTATKNSSKESEEVNKQLQKGTDKVNKSLQKVEDKMDAAQDKMSAGIAKVKAATINKNTWVMRTYHNVTAYYNVYFNAQDSYKEGVQKSAKQYPFDYTNILPIFTFEAKEIPEMVKNEMVRALEKSDKTIKKHSITTKPEIKKGKRLSKKEQEFYNKREYCNSIDDAYLLIGKSNMYLHEYYLAELAFDLVTVDYSTEETSYEARIWNAVMAGELGNTQREQEIITTLQNDKKFPPTYNKLLNRAHADLLIKEKKYGDAIPYVEKSLKDSWNRTNNRRYHFILGQLYQHIGNSSKAIENYTSVVRGMPNYDMEFHAKLNKAFLLTGSKGENMRKTLEKMAKDEKNKEYLDKIYYALAGIEMRAGRTEQAITYYQLSAANSKSDSPQRVLSCLTLAKYFESKGIYEPAQAYYDSTAMVMPKDDPEYEMVSNKAQNLGRLAVNLRIIKTEDSLQRIAKMSPRDRDKYVEKQIAQAKIDEEKMLRNEEIRMARETAAAEAASAFGTPTTGKWYFYNPQVVSRGLVDFRRTWGSRKLADNWRRDSKNIVNDFPSMDEAESKQDQGGIPATQTPEYYLANVPLTDSLMDESNKRLVEAYFDAGMVYKDYIHDKPNAIIMLESLIKRFPNNKYLLESYFYLYVLNNELNNTIRAEYYKNLLIKEYPEELLTKYVLNPKFVSDKEVKEQEANKLYDEAYKLYQSGNYKQAVTLTAKGMEQYKDMLAFASKFKLLNVMATAGNGNIGQYIAGLEQIAKQYSGTEAAQAAEGLLNIVKKRELTLVDEQQPSATTPTTTYTSNYSTDDGESVFAIIVPKKTNLNQLKFNFMSFNADIDADNLTVSNREFNADFELVLVNSFQTQKEAYDYYKKVKRFSAIFKDTQASNHTMFSITLSNLEELEQSKIISLYITFFQSNIEK